MLITRYAKIVMVACLAIFCLIVVFTNLTDYSTNFLFVKHVLSMDTTFPGNALMYRSITAPALWNAAYVLIIAVEVIVGILFLAGAIRLWQERTGPAAAFNGAKGLTVAGVLAAFLLWFFGFMVIGGEWFVMWQSTTWNGQEAAFRFYVTVLAVLIFVNQPDGDLSRSARPVAAKRALAKKRPPARRRAGQGRRRTETPEES
jgi:predicted small integral membrane protein